MAWSLTEPTVNLGLLLNSLTYPVEQLKTKLSLLLKVLKVMLKTPKPELKFFFSYSPVQTLFGKTAMIGVQISAFKAAYSSPMV